MTEEECCAVEGLTSRDKRAIRTAFTKAKQKGIPCAYEKCKTPYDVLMTLPGIKTYNALTGKYEIRPRIESYHDEATKLERFENQSGVSRAALEETPLKEMMEQIREKRMNILSQNPGSIVQITEDSKKTKEEIFKLLPTLVLKDLYLLWIEVQEWYQKAVNDEIELTRLQLKRTEQRLKELETQREGSMNLPLPEPVEGTSIFHDNTLFEQDSLFGPGSPKL